MKKDLKLMRHLLLRLEAADHYDVCLSELVANSKFTLKDAGYNVELLSEAHLIKLNGFKKIANLPDVKDWIICRMTNSGHDFLDEIRNKNI